MSKKDDTKDVAKTVEAPPTLLQRLELERADLALKLDSLVSFLGSGLFHDLEQAERERLVGQRTAMTHYLEILVARIAYHTERGAK